MEIDVIYEDKNFLALNKPAGLLVHGAASRSAGAEPTLVNSVLRSWPEVARVGDNPAKRPGIVHRLDKDTSGIILVAKNQTAFNYLKNLFKKREIKKTYRALVHGRMPESRGVIEKPVSIKPGTVKRTVHAGKLAKEANTEYKVLQVFDGFSWIEVIPKTGRTHQIRLHLASIGHPIVGDSLYGRKKDRAVLPDVGRQMLHAYSLEFSSSAGKRVRLAADLPEDMEDALEYLKGIDAHN